MTVKSAAGVLVLGPVYLRKDSTLVPVCEDALGLTKKQIARCLSFALKSVRNLHIRLNEWDRMEVDINEKHKDYMLVDVNFILNNKDTHRVLDIRLEKGFPVSFESVSVASA